MRQPDLVPLILVKNDEYWLPYVLESVRGWFDRYVIYDIGSTDRTREIIDWFVDEEEKKSDFFVRYLPHVEPVVQGALRNSMIAEARSDWYYILDADELYTDPGLGSLHLSLDQFKGQDDILYGIVPRIEVSDSLEEAWGGDLTLSHHRLYHRTAIFDGPHPGEWPFYKQREDRCQWISGAECYHFHNTERSTKDNEVPKRLSRRGKATYRRGSTSPISILDKLPVLRKRIEDFPVNPTLERLWECS